jgi:hypothetical protein
MVFLSDGAANSAYTYDKNNNNNNIVAICPKATWGYDYGAPKCQDKIPTKETRHPEWLDPPTNTVLNPSYDADDMARDEFDSVTADGTVIFTIGLDGKEQAITKVPSSPPGLTLAPAEQLLKYPFVTKANGGPENSGEYKLATGGASLDPVFLAIANKIATRLTQ